MSDYKKNSLEYINKCKVTKTFTHKNCNVADIFLNHYMLLSNHPLGGEYGMDLSALLGILIQRISIFFLNDNTK